MLDNFSDNYRRDDEEVLNEFRQKQVNFDLEERKNEIDNSRSLFIGALAGLFMAGIVGWFVLAPRYQTNDEDNIPLISRPQQPVKVLPAGVNEVDVKTQDRSVYDVLAKNEPKEENTNIVESTETPNLQAIEKLVEEVAANAPETPAAEVESLTSVAVAPVAEVKKENKTTETKVEEVKTEVIAKKTEVTEPVKEEIKVAEVKKEEVAKVEEVAKAEAVVNEIKKGTWSVQLMSSPNKPAVEKSWLTLSKKYSLLKNLPHEVEKADLGAKGVFYRLKAGSLPTKTEATALCGKLKALGGSCFVVKK
ncbi:MAG: SPOR domain-containing protein [Alphaproteobacteria bacterium]|nr:SPOR domain-containing protein [Alphaproteobacteria bacterium]